MKNLTTLISLFFLTLNSYSQTGCPDVKEESYKKVMSSSFAKDYEKCPVTITAEYFGEGYLKNFRKPRKLQRMYFFQCVNIGDKGKLAPVTNEVSGDFFVIDKTNADKALELKKGDKLKLTGTTFTQNFWGTKLNTFFIVTKIETVQ